MQTFIFGKIAFPDQDRKINQPFFQLFERIDGVAAENMQANVVVFGLQLPHQLHHRAHGVGFRCADGNFARHRFIRRVHFIFGLFNKVDNFLRPFAQEHAVLRERNFAITADKQLLPEFFFQFFELPRQGRLSQMEIAGGARDILFARDR